MFGVMKKRNRQLAMDLRPPARWGGQRTGSGRRAGPGPSVRHRKREAFPGRFPCLITWRLRAGLPSLRSGALVREVRKSFAVACERGEFRVIHFSLQRDHAHLIVEARDRTALGRGLKSIGSRLARAVQRIYDRRGPVLAERYHLQLLRSPRQVRNALAYVLLNARHHFYLRTRSTPPVRADEASSAPWFRGWYRMPPGVTSAGPTPVAEPRSWLLATGWLRHGRIDPAELPGER